MPEHRVRQRSGGALARDLVMDKSLKQGLRKILLGPKVTEMLHPPGASEEDFLLSDSSFQGSHSPCSTLSPETGSLQACPESLDKKLQGQEQSAGSLTLEQFTDIVLAQEGIDPDRVAKSGTSSPEGPRKVILPSVRSGHRLQGEKLKPVVLTPRSVAKPQAACPPAGMTSKLMSQTKEEERRREERLREERRREERPLYESIYSLAGSPGKQRLDQLHPLQLQLLGEGGMGEQVKKQVELAILRNEQVLGASTAPEARRKGGQGGRDRGAQGVMPLNLSIRAGEKLQDPLLQLLKRGSKMSPSPNEASQALINLIAKTGRDLEITRKARRTEKTPQGRSLYSSPPMVAVTPVYPQKMSRDPESSLKRKVDPGEEEGGGKRLRKEEANMMVLPCLSPLESPNNRALSPPMWGCLPPCSPPSHPILHPAPAIKLKQEPVDPSSQEARARVSADLAVAVVQDIHGNCPLHTAVLLANTRLVRRFSLVLLALGRGVDLPNRDGMTALHLAVTYGEERSVEELSRRGADPCVLTHTGDTALHLAVRYGRPACLASMLKRSPGRREVDLCNDDGQAPLHLAVVKGEEAMLKMLLAYGAKVDVQEMTAGKTAMFLAVERGMQDTIEGLLCYGASVSVPNYSGVTPLSLCSENRRLVAVINQCKPMAAFFSGVTKNTTTFSRLESNSKTD